MKALITAGGNGTRLRPITHTLNKHLIPIGNRPMIFHVIDEVKKVGIVDIVINVNKGEKELTKALGDGKKLGVNIKYIEQEQPLGLAHVIKIAQPLIGKNKFVYFLGDNILAGGIKKYVNDFKKNKSNCHLLLSKVKDPERFGVAEVKDGRVIRTVEKPKKFISDLAVTGIYFYDHNIFEAIKYVKPSPLSKGRMIREYDIPPAHQWLIDQGLKVTYSEVTGWWKDTGKPQDLLEGNQLVLSEIDTKIEGEVENTVTIQGRVRVGKGTKITGKSFIRGPVAIGESCVIRDSYIGPFSSIGDRAELYGVEIDHSIIFEDVDIHCSTRIVDSLIGANTLITPHTDTFPSGHCLIIGRDSIVEL